MNKGLEKGGREIQTTFRFQLYMELEWNLEPDPIYLKSVFVFREIHPNKAEFHSCLVFNKSKRVTSVGKDTWKDSETMQYDELARQLAKKNASHIMALSKSVFLNGIFLCFLFR